MNTRSGTTYTADYYQFEKLDSVNMFAEKALAIDNQIADAYYAKGRYEYEKGNFREHKSWEKRIYYAEPRAGSVRCNRHKKLFRHRS